MPSASPANTMYLRRVALVAALVAAGFAGLSAQMVRLSVVQGREHRRAAENKLVSREWLATTRGRILDRKGRVLAQDRPSYDVEAAYDTLSGTWATRRAGAIARKLHRQDWPRLSREERDALIEVYRPAYEAHLERAWAALAEAGGVPEAALARRREELLKDVASLHERTMEQRRLREVGARLRRGEEAATELDERVERRIIASPIAEQRAAHVLLPRVSDSVGFAVRRLAARQTEITFAGPDGGEFADAVPLLPGVSVAESADREYPFDRAMVTVDRSRFPTPLRSTEPATVEVVGLATHVVGWMRAEFRQENAQERDRRLKDARADEDRAGGPGATAASADEDLGRYLAGDSVGEWGVEAAAEFTLRGLRGEREEQLDTGKTLVVQPIPGRDIRLTIDAMLEARIRAAMDPALGLARVQAWHGEPNKTMPVGAALHGAAVVLDIASGDILALVSTPGLSRDVLRDDPGTIFRDTIDRPYVNRAISRPYPPGSIAKAMILCAAGKLGVYSPGTRIECTGHLYPDKPQQFRCWIYKSFHTTHTARLERDPDATDALMASCNIYFYTLGRRLGPEGIAAAYRMFGVTEPWNLGIGRPSVIVDGKPQSREDEYPGIIGDIRRGGSGDRLTLSEATLMGIGQGMVAWTPLHAADVYATIARGGMRIKPRIRTDDPGGPTLRVGLSAAEAAGRSPDDQSPRLDSRLAGGQQGTDAERRSTQAPTPARSRDLGLDPAVVREALAGLRASVNDDAGTGHHLTIEDRGEPRREPIFNIPGVRVWGKTGTADAPWIRGDDPDGQGPLERPVVREGDHSWFVVLVGPAGASPDAERPQFAIAVMMEYAGSGGKVSGPIINQIIAALIEEGYLKPGLVGRAANASDGGAGFQPAFDALQRPIASSGSEPSSAAALMGKATGRAGSPPHTAAAGDAP